MATCTKAVVGLWVPTPQLEDRVSAPANTWPGPMAQIQFSCDGLDRGRAQGPSLGWGWVDVARVNWQLLTLVHLCEYVN